MTPCVFCWVVWFSAPALSRCCQLALRLTGRAKKDAHFRGHEICWAGGAPPLIIYYCALLANTHTKMFRSIASVGRSALRTGAFSRQTMIATEQPTFFNALRAFSDDAAGRSKGVVKWFGECSWQS